MKALRYTSVLFLLIELNFNKVEAQTVYVTEQGKKYHARICSVAKNGKRGISLADAKRLGYQACKICLAEKPKSIKEKPRETKK